MTKTIYKAAAGYIRGERLKVNSYYDYGPDRDFIITHSGDMLKQNGTYSKMNSNGKYLEQCICHMVHQLKDDFKNDIDSLKIGAFSFVKNRNAYLLLNMETGMTVFVVYGVGKYAYEFEFFSPRQFRYADPFIDYTLKHVERHGKKTEKEIDKAV